MVDARSAHPVKAVRAAERAGIDAAPDGALMARASARLAAVVGAHLVGSGSGLARGGAGRRPGRAALVTGSRVVLLVGSGDNGGDALHAGALLARRGARVDALLVRGRAHEGGLVALRAAGGRTAEVLTTDDGPLTRRVVTLLERADAVVDGILGTGGRPGLEGVAALVASALHEGRDQFHRPWVVAVDVPSGVDVETGELPGAHVVADVTVTMGAAKPALMLPPARWAAGEVVVVDLGLEAGLLGPASVTSFDVAAAGQVWPVAGRRDDKYSRGVVGVVAGGDEYTGAAVLAVGGSVVSGAGMVRFVGADHPAELVRQRWPEVVPGSGRVQAWVVGPGLDLGGATAGPAAREALRAAVEDGLPLLLDSGALPLLTDHVTAHGPLDPERSPVLLTPHAGELASLLAALPGAADAAIAEATDGPTSPPDASGVAARPAALARAVARATGTTVLIKGAATLVVPPEGAITVQADGPAWLSTAGSGDVLAGVVGTLLAAGLPPERAGALAALAHGLAGQRANPGGPVHAQDLLAALPGTIAALLAGSDRGVTAADGGRR